MFLGCLEMTFNKTLNNDPQSQHLHQSTTHGPISANEGTLILNTLTLQW